MYFGFLVHLSVVKEPEKSLKSSSVSVSSAASCSWHTAALKAFLPRFGVSVVITNQDETYVYMERERSRRNGFGLAPVGIRAAGQVPSFSSITAGIM